LVHPPAGGFWRATDFPNPFEPKPPPPTLGTVGTEDDDSGRWDAPDESFVTLYCCTEAEGALGEKLAAFMPNPKAVVRIETFLEGDTDLEFADDQLTTQLESEDVDKLGLTLSHVEAHKEPRFIDVWHWRTCVAIAPAIAGLLAKYDLRSLDKRALADERRGFTRRLAGELRDAATNTEMVGYPQVAGLRYESRLLAGWECWALWEPLPIELSTIRQTRVTIDTPELRSAAAKLGVSLVDRLHG
jgi:hypothetical protein